MVIIPKRNWRVCLHCGAIFKKEETKQSISLKTGTFEVCPKCSCPVKKDYSSNLLTPASASSYFDIIENINNGILTDKSRIVQMYKLRNIPEQLWYFGGGEQSKKSIKVKKTDDSGCLVCNMCGYEQDDIETIKVMKKRFKGVETHDIPYYCGACLDTVSDEEYYKMMKEMKSKV